MSHFTTPIAPVSPFDKIASRTFDMQQPGDESLEQRALSAWSERAQKFDVTQAGIVDQINHSDGSPQADLDIQHKLSQQFLGMTLISAVVRKGCAVVETLTKG
jgi:hypothetical protein